MSTEPPQFPAQPPSYWISMGSGAVMVVVLGFRFAQSPGPALIGTVITLGLFGALIAGFAFAARARHRRVRSALPAAIAVPIVVGAELAAATARLGAARSQPGLQLRRSTYAAIAVDATGLHLVSDVVRTERVIEARSVTVTGVGTTMSGIRVTNCILVEVQTEDSTVTLPVIPIRLKNLFRSFSRTELEALASDLRAALAGARVAPDWPN